MIAPADLTTITAGKVLEGAYRLVRLVGEGGMGAVYEAVQLRLNKRVAIKLMSRSAASNTRSLMRFHREAEITSKLGHPHLVNVIDFGTAESGQPYLVMEFLEGEDLEQRLERTGTVPPETAVRIVVQAASALGAAHAQGVVHRDLKPANIFLLQVPGEPEFVKVLDFGISKIKTSDAMRLTGVQSAVGTPSYMSPEQATGRVDDTDHRADQWALACIAWQMLCGHPPFVADDVTALFYQITRVDPPSLAQEVPGLPVGVEDVLRRALSRSHTDRYPSIRDFARAFEAAFFGAPAELTPPPVRLTPSPDLGVPAIAGAQVMPSQSADLTALTPGKRRRALAMRLLWIAGATCFITLALLWLWPRPPLAVPQASGGPGQPAGHAEVAAAGALPSPRVTPLAAATTVTPPTEAASPTAAQSPGKTARAKVARDGGPRHRPARAKPKAVKVQAKHRLFEEL